MTRYADKLKGIRARGNVVLFFLGLAFIGLAGRLAYVQIIKGSEYSRMAENMRLKIDPIFANRGAILDRNGAPFALQTTTVTLTANPKAILKPEETTEILANKLEMPADAILAKLKSNKQYVVIASKLAPEKAQEVVKLQLKGVAINIDRRRDYPYASTASQIIGYLDYYFKGVAGVEKSFNADLTGADGFVKGELDRMGNVIPATEREYKPPVNGADITLTIDLDIQKKVEEIIAKAAETYTPKNITAIVIEPQTGEIFAMANYPTYDLNKRAEELPKDWEIGRNRCISMRFEPGSIFKVIALSAAWEEKLINSATRTYCGGSGVYGGSRIRCSVHGGKAGHGSLTPERVIAESCNMGTIAIANKLGASKFYEYIKKFGVLDVGNIGLPDAVPGQLDSPDKWNAPALQLACVAIGQGVAVTPLAMGQIYATIANDGEMVQPHVIKTIGANAFMDYQTMRVLSPETAQTMRKMLAKVVESGTGSKAVIKGYSIAGKTGTAQKFDNQTKQYSHSLYVSSFVGMLPAEKPRAVIVVMVDEPKGAYYGGAVSAPIFKEIAEYLCWKWRIPPDKPEELIDQLKSNPPTKHKKDDNKNTNSTHTT